MWLPIICRHSIVIASHWVGLTFPGIIDDPGSFSGNCISPKPDLGPEPSNLISLAILNNEAARVFKLPETSTSVSCVARASNLFEDVLKGNLVIFLHSVANFLSKPFFEFRPVPTAVPP